MEINFVRAVPPRGCRNPIDHDKANFLIDELLANPGEWAEIPITWLYPEAEGLSQKGLNQRASSFAKRVRAGTVAMLNQYPLEVEARHSYVYIRANTNKRQLKGMEL